MTDKNEPKIRIVTLDKPYLTENNSNKGCHCDDDNNCPECRVQCICNPECKCNPQCKCNPHHCPCQYEVPCSNKTITNNLQSENNQKEMQTLKECKVNPRTFFKIGENKISN